MEEQLDVAAPSTFFSAIKIHRVEILEHIHISTYHKNVMDVLSLWNYVLFLNHIVSNAVDPSSEPCPVVSISNPCITMGYLTNITYNINAFNIL